MTDPAVPTSAPSAATTPAASRQRAPWLQVGSIRRYQHVRHEVQLPGLPAALQGLRICHMSDLHFHRHWFPAHDALLAELAADPPDLICITGDFVEDKFDHRPALPLLRRFCDGLVSRLGTFAILGNHDGDLLRPRLAECPLHLLENAQAVVPIDGAELEILGLPGVDRDDVDVTALPPHEPGRPRLVLSHFPDLVQHQELAADLVLAGHTHGGQLCLPGGRPIITHDTLPRRMCRGLHRVNDTWLVVSRGMGFSKWRLRVFCPAEVVEVVLR